MDVGNEKQSSKGGAQVSSDVPLERASWFVQGADRAQAEALLTRHGEFLIRQKDSQTPYVSLPVAVRR